jgi:hypothetical protein
MTGEITDIKGVQDIDGNQQPAASDGEAGEAGTETLTANGNYTTADLTGPGRSTWVYLFAAFQSGAGEVEITWLEADGTTLDTTGPADSSDFTSDANDKVEGVVRAFSRHCQVTTTDTSGGQQDVAYSIRVI